MKIVVTYDVGGDRTRTIHGFLSEYLDWIQQSVFEGTISDDEYESIQSWIELFVENDKLVKIYNLTAGETITIGDEQTTDSYTSIDPRTLDGVGIDDSASRSNDSINPMKL